MQDSRLTGGERPLRRRGRLACLALCLGAFAFLNAAPSFAANAGLADSGATLSYVAASGELNNVTIAISGTDYVITDSGVASIADAGGCTVTAPPAPAQATCPAAGVTNIHVDLGDGADTLSINDSTAARVLARDGAQDTITCTGTGTVGADAADQVTGCTADLPPDTTFVPVPDRIASNAPDFNVGSSDATGIECRFDGTVSPCTGTTLADGSHTFEAAASDAFGTDPTPVSQSFVVDTTGPDTVIDSGPPSTSDSNQATFSFFSIGADAAGFQCKLDGGDWQPCTSPSSYRGLTEAPHTFRVRAVDDLGNVDATEAVVEFTVLRNPVSASGLPTGLIIVRPPASFVLIGGNTVRVSRKRIATVTLNCSGNRDCAGELTLTTAKRIKLSRKRRRYVRLGAATFFVPAPKSATIKIPLTKRAFRIVKKRKRIKTMITVTDKDRVGRTRISTREVFLKAR
jgi:hypothetical protein